jgi:hypothetical protein
MFLVAQALVPVQVVGHSAKGLTLFAMPLVAQALLPAQVLGNPLVRIPDIFRDSNIPA